MLDSRFSLREKTVGAVGLLAAKGVSFVLVSARMQATMLPLHKALGLRSPMICYSGALTVDGEGGKLDEHLIGGSDALEIYRFIRTNYPDVTCSAYYGPEWIVRDINDKNVIREINIVGLRPEQRDIGGYIAERGKLHKLFCVGGSAQIENIYRSLCGRFPDKICACKSKDIYIEITDKNATKANAVKKFCALNGISVEETMAVGDHNNDLDMLRAAGIGVAMGNAPENVKENADMVVASKRRRDMLGDNAVAACFKNCSRFSRILETICSHIRVKLTVMKKRRR